MCSTQCVHLIWSFTLKLQVLIAVSIRYILYKKLKYSWNYLVKKREVNWNPNMDRDPLDIRVRTNVNVCRFGFSHRNHLFLLMRKLFIQIWELARQNTKPSPMLGRELILCWCIVHRYVHKYFNNVNIWRLTIFQ